MTDKITLQQLETFLWDTADILRGNMDASESANGEDAANLSLAGQEMNLNTWAICKMNMFLHGVFLSTHSSPMAGSQTEISMGSGCSAPTDAPLLSTTVSGARLIRLDGIGHETNVVSSAEIREPLSGLGAIQ